MGVTVPADWNLASFGGDAERGNLRIDDPDGPRLELRWEQPKGDIDLESSVARFLEQLERQAQKKKEKFTLATNPMVLDANHGGREEMVNFGWSGEPGAVLAGQGWGVSWRCGECGRVVVAHLLGRGREKPDRVRRLAGDILATLDCHGHGGWQTWSVFGLRLEVPEEFRLSHARLLTGRIELEWVRPAPPPPRGWFRVAERVGVTRITAANLVLEGRSLAGVAQTDVARTYRKLRFNRGEAATIHGHEGWLLEGVLRDVRLLVRQWVLDRLLRRRTPRAQLRVWHCPTSNKLYGLCCAVAQDNGHICPDMLDSLECHDQTEQARP